MTEPETSPAPSAEPTPGASTPIAPIADYVPQPIPDAAYAEFKRSDDRPHEQR